MTDAHGIDNIGMLVAAWWRALCGTRREGANMEPGRKLDVLIAEKVMGWRDIRPFTSGIVRATYIGVTSDGLEGEVGFYSTNIADAWQVVERITRIPRSREEAERAANTRFGLWWDNANLWSYSAPKAAHLICLAALKALGVNSEVQS